MAEICAFKTYCWQRINMVSQLGVAKTIRANAPFPCGPRHVGPYRGTWDIGTPAHQPRKGPLVEQFVPNETETENADGIMRSGWPQTAAQRLAENLAAQRTQNGDRVSSFGSGRDFLFPAPSPLSTAPRPQPLLPL